MKRDLRIFLLAIALPALLLTLAGLRLVQNEAQRLDDTDRAGLASAAAHAAAEVCIRVQAEIDPVLDSIASATNDVEELLQKIESSHPYVRMARIEGKMENEARKTDGQTQGAGPQRPWMFRRRMWTHPRGGRAATFRVKTHQGATAIVDIEPLYALSRFPEMLVECGADNPADTSRLATIAEIRQQDDALLAPATSLPLGNVWAEASLAPVFPHWKIRLYRRAGPAALAPDRYRFRLLGTVLLLLLVCSFVSGAVVLLRAARRARREALAKTDFISNVSHELKTPLTTISLCAELGEMGGLSAEEARSAFKSIGMEASRLRRMVEEVLNFSRLERGRKSYRIETIDLGDLASEVAQLVKDRFVQGLEVEKGVFLARGDRDAVRQIFVNLLDNAAKYAAAQGVVEIGFTRSETGHEVCASVRDHGPGVAPEDREKVFARFWRGDDSTTSTVGGNGLGLSISRALAEGMGGRLELSGESSPGCKFVLTLPSADEQRKAGKEV